ncbi:uncharacterized protein MELLADRAFT_88305 [Melampsora larici-populina 98AG31]|uniref:Uncharacterized protein n=1 Tax=Melampsora larici-populina (strain 98AG31 / pathotype 3-4-7) TaxID=747676 RepID=F4SE51_MELLP|nr:uncharacterized protein MELLADRAFT_88305 [Melampsora larici-populina 98AG31]EGF97075.1 hypothetical protein MELLADRAFT_88305 [Melampsora larici-populina 98AG31]
MITCGHAYPRILSEENEACIFEWSPKTPLRAEELESCCSSETKKIQSPHSLRDPSPAQHGQHTTHQLTSQPRCLSPNRPLTSSPATPTATRSAGHRPHPATKKKSQLKRHRRESSSDENSETERDSDSDDGRGTEDEDEEDDVIQKLEADAIIPTLNNYNTVGEDWTDAYIDKLLATRKTRSNNRPSQEIVSEALALQSIFHRSLKILSLAGHVSYPTLKAALFMGPSQRPITSYDEYRTYSKKTTQDLSMPPRNTSRGFVPRNKAIGRSWTGLQPLQKAVFHPPLFKRLALNVLQPQEIQSSSVINIQPNEDPHNPSDLTPYLSDFKELVNMKKVEKHFERGCLAERQSLQTEKKGRVEVGKLVKQLHTFHSQYDIEFHLLVASFHPKTKLAKALWMEEYTSCARWADLVKSEHHLLENFAKESTQCPRDVFKVPSKKPQPTTTQIKQQTVLRQQLTTNLNKLVEAQLPYTPRQGIDIHPKGPNSDAQLEQKKFLQDIQLKVARTPDCKVTDAMLAKGAAPGNMTMAHVRLWLEEIEAKRYTVILKNGD